MKKLAIIPARSGSKGLRNKNIIELCGKPLMAYAIEAALKSEEFDKIIVSTDSKAYAEIAKYYGAESLIRSAKLSSDTATTYMVIEDVLQRVTNSYDYFMLLQPTSPLRTSKHICEAVKLFESKWDEFDFLVSMKESEQAGILVRPLDEIDSLKNFDTDFANYRRQTYQDFSPNGAIYIGKCDKYIQKGHFFGEHSLAYKMDKESSIDIDDIMDYELASLVLKRREIENE